MATVAVDNLPLQPVDTPYGQPLGPLTRGDRVYVVDGPRMTNGREYWELAGPTAMSGIGWAPADESGAETLLPYSPNCPTKTALTTSDLAVLSSLERLVCFGGRELNAEGAVACYEGVIDGGTGGAWFFDSNHWCELADVMSVHGPAVMQIRNLDGRSGTIVGNYRLTGHFDDPASLGCAWFAVRVSLDMPAAHPDPSAVIACRQDFVATEAPPL